MVEGAADAVGLIRLLRQAVHGDDDTVESGGDKGFCEVWHHRLRVGRDDGIKPGVVRLTDHERQVFVEQGFALEIKLHNPCRVFYLR